MGRGIPWVEKTRLLPGLRRSHGDQRWLAIVESLKLPSIGWYCGACEGEVLGHWQHTWTVYAGG